MALDGILLNKIIENMQDILPARIQKIYEISNTEVLLQVHCAKGKKQILISAHSVYNRMLITDRSYPTPDTPDNFIMVLRKYLEGGTIQSIEQAGLDRWCTFHIRRRNNIGDMENISLVVELMGKYANVILVSKENRIIDALKRIPPFENSTRMILPQAEFVPMKPQNKKDPFKEFSADPSIPFVRQFAGFSPLLGKEAEYRMAHGQSFHDFMMEIQNSTSLFIHEAENREPVFHCVELKHAGMCHSYPLFEGFDLLYYHKEEKDRIRQITGDLYHFVNRELKHQRTKLPRLLKEYDNALDCEKWKKYGDLLFTWSVQDTKGRKEIELQDYETGQNILVPLDERLDGSGNARKCYSRYNKLKKGQVYLKEQIDISENEISYFEGLLEQLDQADFETAGEIQEELIRQGYLRNRQKGNRKKKKKKEEKPHVTTVTSPSGIQVSYGRNNLQNDALTWHMAHKNEVWMHAKDYHGSHVVIHDEHPDEATMRFAANLAAWFSQGRHSSSVPVVYCHVKTLKKIPGAKPGMVQLGPYKMIYIDPDADELMKQGVQI